MLLSLDITHQKRGVRGCRSPTGTSLAAGAHLCEHRPQSHSEFVTSSNSERFWHTVVLGTWNDHDTPLLDRHEREESQRQRPAEAGHAITR
jgi:hypothetical protein